MPAAPDSTHHNQCQPWLDRPGLIQVIGGLLISLIALFSSYDHVTLASATLPIQQQWGIVWIAASLALVLIDAQLATRSRRREEHRRIEAARATAEERERADRERDKADRERHRADQERDRADQERNRAAEARERTAETAERQREGIALLRGAALLTARVQLDPSELNRSRLSAYLALLAEQSLLDREGPEV